jgi:hypothetical protein
MPFAVCLNGCLLGLEVTDNTFHKFLSALEIIDLTYARVGTLLELIPECVYKNVLQKA